MLRHKKIGHDGKAGRQMLMIVLPVLLAVTSLIAVPNTYAEAQITSGVTALSNTLAYGNTAYSIDYSYPSTADVGSNLTIAVTLHVNSLTGLVEYITNYGIFINVFVGAGHVLNGSVAGAANATLLYPGAAWGPNEIIIPLTADNTGLAKGASANATLSIRLVDRIRYGGQIGVYDTEPAMQGQAGSLTIQNSVPVSSSSTIGQTSGQAQTYLPYALLTVGSVLMLSAAFFPSGTRPPQTKPKS
jgi:hypothetical protein